MKIQLSLLLSLLVHACAVWAQTTHSPDAAEQWSRVKIEFGGRQSPAQLQSLGLLHQCGVHWQGKQTYVAEYSASELQRLAGAGIKYELLVKDLARHYAGKLAGAPPPGAAFPTSGLAKSANANHCGAPQFETPANFTAGSMGGHYTFDEMVAHLDNMFLLYPNLVTAKQTMATLTGEGRPIYWLRISDNPTVDEPEPEVLYTALHHAREPMSMMQMIYFMYYLLENYGTDAAVTSLVDNTEFYFVPCLNPDGYVYNQTINPAGGGMWRKNRRNNGDGSFGVDPNRNYGYNWGYDDVGSSPSPSSATYRGTAAFSEPENQAMRDFCIAHNFAVALNYHTYGNYLIYPWGYGYGLYTPDHAIFREFAHSMTHHSRHRYGTGDETLNYITNGDSDDWMYGEQTLKGKILSYTPELGANTDGFWASADRILPLCEEVMPQNLLAARYAGCHAEPQSESPANIAALSGQRQFSLRRLGLEEGCTFTVSVTPLTDNIMFFAGMPQNFSGAQMLERQYGTFSCTLRPGTLAGETVSYLLRVGNGSYEVATDTVVCLYQPDVAFDDAEASFNANWTSSSVSYWNLTNETVYAGLLAASDSPFGDYPNNAVNTLTLQNPVDLTEADQALLTFRAKWALESAYDYVQLSASTNGGADWEPLCGKLTKPGTLYQALREPLYDGVQDEWLPEEIWLNDYVGQYLWLRFELVSDGSVTGDGFYFDGLKVFSVPEGERVEAKLLLEGAFDVGSGLMQAGLAAEGLLPLEQPFYVAPWWYAGNECFDNAADLPANAIDWVLLELRTAGNGGADLVERRAGILLSDGTVVGHQGQPGLGFRQAVSGQAYYLAVRHRNHLAVMSSVPVSVPAAAPYDFTSAGSQAYGFGQLKPLGGKHVLRAGDFNADGVNTVADFNLFNLEMSGMNQYLNADATLDGNATVGDYNLFLKNAAEVAVAVLRY